MIFLSLDLFKYYREEYLGHCILETPLTSTSVLRRSPVQRVITSYGSGAARFAETVQQQDRVAFLTTVLSGKRCTPSPLVSQQWSEFLSVSSLMCAPK